MECELIIEGGAFGVGDWADAVLLRADGSYSEPGIRVDLSGIDFGGIGVGGTFHVACEMPNGFNRWVDDAKNSVTNGALDDVLNVYLGGTGTLKTSWYLLLADNASFTAFANGDTIASHSGWLENTNWTGSTRPLWTVGTSSGQTVTNASTVNFPITATVSIRGLGLCSDSTKGGTAGLLFSTAAFSGGVQACNTGDTLKVTYSVGAATT